MLDRPHTVSIEAIKQGLVDQIEGVVARLAPPAPGSYRKGDLYFTLNPGRADNSVGSFCIHMHGAMAGKWTDYAMNGRAGHGDLIDLFGLVLGLNPTDAIREARAFLGLENDTPEMRRAREDGARRAAAARAAHAAKRAEQAAARTKWAEGLWLSGQERIAGTPVEDYLKGRGIDLARLGRQPRSIRYHPECLYVGSRDAFDPETGEVLTDDQGRTRAETWRAKLPAMVTSIVDARGRIIATHRTYLARRANGSWGKAALPDAKKVLGDYAGGCVRLASGLGPRGGKGAALNICPAGTRVYVAEGIETALSALMLRPEIRVVAAVSLRNMALIQLPPGVTEVVLIADHDEHPQAVAAFQAAVDAHAQAGRTVRVWRSPVPGEDLNDVLVRVRNEEGVDE